jgi:hypothetical protein
MNLNISLFLHFIWTDVAARGERNEVFHFSTTLFATFVHFPPLSIFFTFSLYLLMMQKLFHFDYRLQKRRTAKSSTNGFEF